MGAAKEIRHYLDEWICGGCIEWGTASRMNLFERRVIAKSILSYSLSRWQRWMAWAGWLVGGGAHQLFSPVKGW